MRHTFEISGIFKKLVVHEIKEKNGHHSTCKKTQQIMIISEITTSAAIRVPTLKCLPKSNILILRAMVLEGGRIVGLVIQGSAI